MGCITGLGRCLVAFLNIIFVIISLVLIAAGVIAYKASDISFLKDLETAIKNGLSNLATSTGNPNTAINNFSISEILGGLAMCLIIAGCILLVLSFFGCCGACYKFKTLVFLYGFIITVLLVGEITVVILMYAAPNTIQGAIKDVLLETLKQYQGLQGTNVVTLSWLFVMKEMKCCGVNGYKDFSVAALGYDKSWTITDDINAPLVCCIVAPRTNDEAKCARTGNFTINEQGCYDAVWNTVLGNPKWAGTGFGAGFTFQLLLIIFSILMYIDMGNKKNKKVYPNA